MRRDKGLPAISQHDRYWVAVDKERGLDAEGSINDGREAVGPIMAATCEAADARAIPADHQPVSVMLDFVDSQRAGRWLRVLKAGTVR
jgi:hypothetical protein